MEMHVRTRKEGQKPTGSMNATWRTRSLAWHGGDLGAPQDAPAPPSGCRIGEAGHPGMRKWSR